MKKNSNNKYDNNYPFSDEVKKAKHGFKKMIDEMPDEEFMEFMLMFMGFIEELEDLDDGDLEDDSEDLPF